MKALIATDTKFYYENGRLFATEKMARIVPRYYNSFGKVVLIARQLIEKNNVELKDITEMVESLLLFRDFKELYSRKYRSEAECLAKDCDLIVGRFEGFSAIYSYDLSRKLNKPFFGEVMSDPWDGLWNHSLLGKFAAPFSYFKTKEALKNAQYALYVTNDFLQSRYPCLNESVAVSNVFIQETDRSILNKRLNKIDSMNLNKITIMTTAATYVKYKGQQYVISAIPLLNKVGIKVKYYIVGEGSQEYLKHKAKKFHVEEQVVFTGRLPLDQVLSTIDTVDIYIQPSLQEGLPRSVIEAMSKGCPCLGARTAGIPELIQKECVFERKSRVSIYKAIISVLDKNKLKKFAEQNFLNAKQYEDKVLDERRKAYFEKIAHDINVGH